MSALIIGSLAIGGTTSVIDASQNKKVTTKKKNKKAPKKAVAKKKAAPAPAQVKALPKRIKSKCTTEFKDQYASPAPAMQPVATDVACDRHVAGGYVGINAGVSHLSGNIDMRAVNTQSTPDIRQTKSGISVNGIGGDLNLGWIFKMGSFGLGVEGYFDPTSAQSKTTTVSDDITTDLKLSLKRSFGLVTKLGFFVNNDVFTYIRLGMERQKVTATLISSDGTNDIYNPFTESYTVNGLATGLGVKYLLSNHFALQGEYRLNMYGEKKLTKTIIDSRTHTTTVKIKPQTHDFRVGVAYQF